MLVTAGAPIVAIACDDTGPSPIGVYADPDASAAEETPTEDAGEDAGEDASDDAATDADGGSDAGDAGDADADARTN